MNTQSKQKRIAFGYNRGPINQIEINEGQAAAVKLIYDWYCEGKSLAQIVTLLSDIGVPSPQNKQTWGRQALANILSNEHYTGADNYPVIISIEQFQTVQVMKERCAAKV